MSTEVAHEKKTVRQGGFKSPGMECTLRLTGKLQDIIVFSGQFPMQLPAIVQNVI